MHRPFPLLLGTLLGLAACDETATTAPPLLRTDVPITGSYRAIGTIGTAPRCDAVGLLHVTLEGGGVESHGGRYTITNSHCLDPVTGDFSAGTFRKITASGDELHGSYGGTSSVIQAPAPVGIFAIDGQLVFNGGTGRFADATGSQHMLGRQTSDFSQPGIPTSVELRLIGTISTVGSTP